jgi:DNA-directed RNA polymerase specialized sigma24 family protein
MELNDTELVSQSLSGSREAFGRIVEQYQSLICSIAYSATGSLCQSEDCAQETFVIAWKELPKLPCAGAGWVYRGRRSMGNGERLA